MLVSTMRVLFAISVVCFCTVLWIALSLARRLRTAQSKENKRSEHATTTEFFEAGEFRTPRPMRLNQEIRPKRQQAVVESAADDERVKAPSAETLAPAHRSGLRLVTATKPQPVVSGEDAQTNMQPSEITISGENTARRKSPQPSRASGFRRVDLSHYTGDMGDLTDPYTHPLRGSGTQGSPSKNP